jgi:hypothetical protein
VPAGDLGEGLSENRIDSGRLVADALCRLAVLFACGTHAARWVRSAGADQELSWLRAAAQPRSRAAAQPRSRAAAQGKT